MCLFLELSGLNNSELVEGTAETVRKKKKNVTWAWKIKCGLCNNLVQLRIDGAHARRVSYFKTRKWRNAIYQLSSMTCTCLHCNILHDYDINLSYYYVIWKQLVSSFTCSLFYLFIYKWSQCRMVFKARSSYCTLLFL